MCVGGWGLAPKDADDPTRTPTPRSLIHTHTYPARLEPTADGCCWTTAGAGTNAKAALRLRSRKIAAAFIIFDCGVLIQPMCWAGGKKGADKIGLSLRCVRGVYIPGAWAGALSGECECDSSRVSIGGDVCEERDDRFVVYARGFIKRSSTSQTLAGLKSQTDQSIETMFCNLRRSRCCIHGGQRVCPNDRQGVSDPVVAVSQCRSRIMQEPISRRRRERAERELEDERRAEQTLFVC